MLTGLILADGDAENLALTLSALVPAVVEGLVGDAVVIARPDDQATARVAEIAGARLAVTTGEGDPWQQGGSLARREWLLCLNAGDMPTDGWMRAVEHFLSASARDQRALGRFARRGSGITASLSRLAERVVGARTIRAGDLVQRDWLVARNGARMRPIPIAARIDRVI